MRNWKNWLFPILTCLTVAALALLPLRLSTLRDGELTGTVHTEALAEDSNFPFKPPDLPGRIWLLLQWQEMPDGLTIMAQELEGTERNREMERLHKALSDLEDVLPPGLANLLISVDGDSWDWERYYLRDQADLSSASFTLAGTYDKRAGISFSATMDVESGQIIGLQVAGTQTGKYAAPPLETGKALLDHLGLNYEPADNLVSEDVYGLATFRLLDCKSWLMVSCSGHSLSFQFNLDWEAMENEIAESYGHPGASATDANSIQKW